MGRKSRLGPNQRAALWPVFQAVREAMARTSDADMRSYEEETREWLDADLGA